MPGVSIIRCASGQGHLRFTIDFSCTNEKTLTEIRDIVSPFEWGCVENIDGRDGYEGNQNSPYLLYSKSKGETACFEAGTIAGRLKSHSLSA